MGFIVLFLFVFVFLVGVTVGHYGGVRYAVDLIDHIVTSVGRKKDDAPK